MCLQNVWLIEVQGQCWSAVGDPSNAIDNINLALEFDYPQQDRYKLYLRRGKQYLALRVCIANRF